MKIKTNNQTAALLLRIGLASVLLYASIASLKTPNDWIGYLPQFLVRHVNGRNALYFFSVYELALAIWLLSGKYIRYAAVISALTFSGIVLANIGVFSITFRDLAMVFASLALVFIETKS